jgi:hypothetical protein
LKIPQIPKKYCYILQKNGGFVELFETLNGIMNVMITYSS